MKVWDFNMTQEEIALKVAKEAVELSDTIRLNSEFIIEGTADTVPYYYFPHLRATGIVKDAFSTRLGGVSKGVLSHLNLGTNRGDLDENVYENYRRMGLAIGVTPEQMVLSKQTHTTNVRVVGKEDAGNGILRPNAFEDVDGMITDERNLVLVTSYADCVPLYFVDPVKKVIGLSHSGWRGTVNQMGLHTVEAMVREYHCAPENILGAIGPSICQECYEVSEDVACRFEETFHEDIDIIIRRNSHKEGKYMLNLWKANEIVMKKAGLREENIKCAGICTCEHPDIFFSHRASGGQRGNVCAFLVLK